MDHSPERRRPKPGRRIADLWLRLTPRQRQVLDLVATAASNKQIAAELGMSEQGAKQQVSKLLARFDVTSRTALAQAALAIRITGQRNSDLPLEYLFDRAPIAIAMTSGPKHTFAAINRTFVELFGERGGWVGQRLSDLLTPPEAALVPFMDAAYRAGAPKQRTRVPVRWSDPDGSAVERTLTVSIQPTRASNGRVAGLMLFGIDVTDHDGRNASVRSPAAEREAIVGQGRRPLRSPPG